MTAETNGFNSPLVSIGMPVYNSETTIRRAIETIVNQTYKNIEIIISDNNSTDSTFKICNDFAMQDDRIKLVSQEVNIGPTRNFQCVLDGSKGKYFMWAAGDDFRSLDFIEVNVNALEKYPNCVASTSPNVFPGQDLNSSKISTSLKGTRVQRFKSFFEHPGTSHALFYSLMRREVLIKCSFIEELFFAWDWAIDLHMANYGEIHRTQAGEIFFTPGVSMQSSNPYKRLGLTGIKTLYPFLIFNKKVLEIVKNWTLLERLEIYKLLINRNWMNLSSDFKKVLLTRLRQIEPLRKFKRKLQKF